MRTMASSQYTHASLPKLSTSKVICRRDSLSSSKTRDSGYNSDLDTLSPLELFGFEQDILLGPLPPTPNVCFTNKPALTKRYHEFEGSSKIHKFNTTSITGINTSSCHIVDDRRYTSNSSGVIDLKTNQDYLPHVICEDEPVPQDEDIEKWIRDNLPSRNRPNERVSSITSLSSTSSCDMHTNTDISDDEHEYGFETTRNLHSRSTLKTVELIIRKTEVVLRQAAHKQCTSSGTSNSRSVSSLLPLQSGRKTSQSSGHKRKAGTERSPPPEDDDEDGPHKRRRGSATTTEDSETGAKFACPFYKHDPDRYRARRTCAGPGWPTVHRMKEHLYRSHAQPIFCPICYSTFKSDKEQSSHVRLQQCQRSAPQHIEGVDREKVWTLRKRTTALRLEEDKWRDVYQVLFPDVPVADVPSPFYNCDSPSESSRRFRRELLRRVQEELFTTAEQVPGPVEQQLLQRVAQIIRNCEADLLRTPGTSVVNTLLSDRRASNGSTGSMMSGVSISQHVTPAPFSRFELNTTSSSPCAPPPVYQGQSESSHPSGAADTIEPYGHSHLTVEPAVNFTPIIWDDQTYNAFSLGIDWDVEFPAGSGAQPAGGNDAFSGLSVPMYT